MRSDSAGGGGSYVSASASAPKMRHRTTPHARAASGRRGTAANGPGERSQRSLRGNSCCLQGMVLPALCLFVLVASLQLAMNALLYGSGKNQPGTVLPDAGLRGRNGHREHTQTAGNSYDSLLKNTIHYAHRGNYSNSSSNSIDAAVLSALQDEIDNLRSQITTLESKSQKYVDDPRFFPFVIRDSRHLTPVQVDPDFHVFDYVDLTQALQPKSKHSQLLHNARIVVDEELEERRRAGITKIPRYAEKYEAPCQIYSVECYRKKVLQVFSYILRKFPSVEYYFYVEADNDLCVPMTMVKDLALTEKRYFINTGIGFSGWIMSREFLGDFIELYGNSTLDRKVTKVKPGTNETVTESPEIRPDVLASYYLTDKQAWTVTRQYWVSHTTLESLGIASLTVKDRRKNATGERMKLDKHLPRCLEPRRGKWKVSRKKPYLDPRDRFGWDYFDYEVCPNELLFPCGGPDQLKKLVADDLRVANETGALAKWAKMAEQKRRREAKQAAKKRAAGEQNPTPKEKAAALRERLRREEEGRQEAKRNKE